ncbi:glycoside hydrolase family 2 protein [Cryobacterium lactosi]|uniref:Glycoside hydrolase family 2 protein n=1 Tax=Cryobacterium lactosi TaxID=1259202 RepID=A0A4R9BGH5_9MICO|nr:glycoside hydrolase family 2 TIM barrel-domain containing protein [Cryobacterium lactosi]TFD84014.1 glycoside hydrolase family 2 protein [Cryobacterium lactosi]
MTATLFTDGWTFGAQGEAPAPVTLPHDAMISETRTADAPSGAHGGYFAGGSYVYAKRWFAPAHADDRLFRLFFEGVYGDATILLNGEEVGNNISGYREFVVPLPGVVAGAENLIEVQVDNADQPNSRWYSGSGIYRRVWLEDFSPVHLDHGGLTLRTVSLGDPAILEAVVDLDRAAHGAELLVRLVDDGVSVAESRRLVTGPQTTLTLEVPNPKPWSDRSPHLYTVYVALLVAGVIVDEQEMRTGLRTVDVDPRRGLLINGVRTLLRGGCVHHDSGPLGAATFRAAEYRRARILKENGFNAIRSAHTPMSRDLLDACDELGLYVLDELTDVWSNRKVAFDLAPRFEEIWPDDARSMVAKDRNHPSVIIYSIGNENTETSTPAGVETAREMRAFVKALDPDRPVTAAVNFLLNLMAGRKAGAQSAAPAPATPNKKRPTAVTSTAANIMADKLGSIMQLVARAPGADKTTRDVLATLDVASYNYAWGRYKSDAKRHPDRVVLGSESLPGDIVRLWPIVEKLPNVIGDFSWTAWDYLGEAGIGTWAYGEDSLTATLSKPFPHVTAGPGAIDITGVPGAQSLLNRAVWGLLDEPAVTVRPLDRAGEKIRRTAWRSTDAVASWSWAGAEGKAAELEVYSTDEEVEVFVNGRTLGRKRAGARVGFVTRYRTEYEPGEVVAVGYRGRVETARSSLRSCDAPTLTLVAETSHLPADKQELVFVRIEIADENGVVEMLQDDVITLEVSGNATLAALGSGAPATTESFSAAQHSTHYGRALAIIRSDGTAGPVSVKATSTRHGSAELQLAVLVGT